MAWSVAAGFVLAGAAFAALQLSGLDPFGPFPGTGELAGRSPRVRQVSA